MASQHPNADIRDILDAFRDVAEDLAIEILAEFSEDDMQHIQKTLNRLHRASTIFLSHQMEVPGAVKEVLKHRNVN